MHDAHSARWASPRDRPLLRTLPSRRRHGRPEEICRRLRPHALFALDSTTPHLAEILGPNLANWRMYTPPLLLHLVQGGREMSMELIELSNALVKATDHTAASVVAVHTEARGSSSGVIWRPGVIVTAEHALRRDEEIQATLPNGRVVPATLAGRDPSTDLAVLKCPDARSVSAA